MNYITFLCARQAKKRVATAYPEFMKAHTKDVRALNRLLDQQILIRKKISPKIEDSAPFLDWYEKMFLCLIEQPNLGEDQ
jgi:hypothetical protein